MRSRSEKSSRVPAPMVPGRALRIVVVADGNPREKSTNSGVSSALISSLEMRKDVDVVGVIDSMPSLVVRNCIRLLSWRRNKVHWRNQARKGALATRVRSYRRDRGLRRLRGQFDLVLHVRNTYLPTASPYIAFLDGTGSLGQRYWKGWEMSESDYRVRVSMERRYFAGAFLVATAGAYVVDEIRVQYDQPMAKLVSVGGGTSFSIIEPNPFREEDPLRFLFVGTEFARKGGEHVIEAFRRLRLVRPDITLTIVGPPRPESAEPGITWRGYVSDRTEMRAIYRASDVFCLPSVYEPYGLVIQEALAHGLPSIVSNRGALPELAGEAGVVVEASSTESLLSAMLAMIDDVEQRRRLAIAAPQQLVGRTWDDVAERLVRAMTRALSLND